MIKLFFWLDLGLKANFVNTLDVLLGHVIIKLLLKSNLEKKKKIFLVNLSPLSDKKDKLN